jgi:hypothetical protein
MGTEKFNELDACLLVIRSSVWINGDRQTRQHLSKSEGGGLAYRFGKEEAGLRPYCCTVSHLRDGRPSESPQPCPVRLLAGSRCSGLKHRRQSRTFDGRRQSLSCTIQQLSALHIQMENSLDAFFTLGATAASRR